MNNPHTEHANHAEPRRMAYRTFAVMMTLSFVAMYGLMYAMVNAAGNVYANLNQAYMALLMVSPMAVFELILMRRMYPDRRLNLIIGVAAVVAVTISWIMIRQQTAIGDRQFLRSMIPHHAGAILMCHEATIEDARIKSLCQSIEVGQQSEIDQMKTILETLSKTKTK